MKDLFLGFLALLCLGVVGFVTYVNYEDTKEAKKVLKTASSSLDNLTLEMKEYKPPKKLEWIKVPKEFEKLDIKKPCSWDTMGLIEDYTLYNKSCVENLNPSHHPSLCENHLKGLNMLRKKVCDCKKKNKQTKDRIFKEACSDHGFFHFLDRNKGDDEQASLTGGSLLIDEDHDSLYWHEDTHPSLGTINPDPQVQSIIEITTFLMKKQLGEDKRTLAKEER